MTASSSPTALAAILARLERPPVSFEEAKALAPQLLAFAQDGVLRHADGWNVAATEDHLAALGPDLMLLARPGRSVRVVWHGHTCVVETDGTTSFLLVPPAGSSTAFAWDADGEACVDPPMVRIDEPTVVSLDHGGATVIAPPPPPPEPPSTSPPPPSPPPWRASHRVGDVPLTVGGVPHGRFDPGIALDPWLEVRMIETTADGWALVECSNTWQCYVPSWGLEPLE